MRPVAFVLLVAVVTATSVRGQPDLHILKTHFPTVGDKVKVTVEEKTEIKITVSGAKVPTVVTTLKKLEYEDEVIAVGDKKIPSRLKRHYTKATVKADGKDSAFKIEGKTVVIFNGFGDDFTYTIEKEKTKLDPDSLALLDGEFKKGNRERLIEVLHPTTKAVKVNDPWKLDSVKLVGVLNDNYDTDFKVEKPKGEGKLVKLNPLPKFDPKKEPRPKQTGVIEITADAQVVSTDKATFELKGGTLSFTFTGEGVLDGSAPQGKSTAVVKIKGASTIDGQAVDLEVIVTEVRTMEPRTGKK